jgi:hypothetical protein
VFLSLLVAAALGSAGSASAHGGKLRAFEILNNRARPEEFIVRSDAWGFFHSQDAGKTWQWSCSVPYRVRTAETQHVNMSLTPGGRLIVASGFEGVYYTDDLCTWSRATGMEPALPDGGDVLLVPDAKVLADGTVLSLTSTGIGQGVQNHLLKSRDGGASFSLAKDLQTPDLALYSIAQAPSDPNRLYVLGVVIGEQKGAILRSKDGGATFDRMDAPWLDEPRLSPRIHAVHPTNPDWVFVWLDVPEKVNENSPDEIWASGNGGESWVPAMMGRGDLPGLAFSPDGKTVVVGGVLDGAWRGSVADLVEKGESALTQVNPLATWGLFWNGDGLYAGKDNFTARGTPETFTMGISQDEGTSFKELLGICDLQFSYCPSGTQGHDLCVEDWETPAGGFKQDFWVNSERCEDTPDAGTRDAGTRDAGARDAAVVAPVAPEKSGCSCSTPGTNAPNSALVALTVGVVGFGLLRRRSCLSRRGAGACSCRGCASAPGRSRASLLRAHRGRRIPSRARW